MDTSKTLFRQENSQKTLARESKIADENENFPFIVLSPQCPNHYIWPFVYDGIMAILGEVIERYPVDPRRFFITGLSMGGYATWDLTTEYPEKFAGIVPVCGSNSKNESIYSRMSLYWHSMDT